MNRKLSRVSAAALAGASCLLTSQVSKAAITVVGTKVASSVAFKNGTYDVIDFDLTSLTGADATTGLAGQDAEIYALQGTFTVTGGSMAFIGTASTQGGDFTLPYAQANYVAAPGLHSSYVPFANDIAPTTVGNSGAAKAAGTATSVSDTWYTTPAVKSGPAGGVEPGVNTAATPSTSDPYAQNGLLAEILVTPNATVSFSGSYSDYGNQAGAPISFSYGTTTVPPTSNKIVSLVTTGVPSGYGNSSLGTLTVQNAGGSGKYFPGYLNISGGATAGYIAVKGFLPNDVPEVYALQVAIGGSVLLPTDTRLASIIADIKGSDSNISGGVTTVLGSPYAALFPGYDLIVPTSIAGGSSPYFAFDFSLADGSDTDTGLGQVSVTSIAAVPEPATAAGVVLGAAGLLLGRRKNRVQAV